MDAVCCIERWRWQGQAHETWVYRRAGNRYTAETCLGPGDRIVSDGRSEDEALRAHRGSCRWLYGHDRQQMGGAEQKERTTWLSM